MNNFIVLPTLKRVRVKHKENITRLSRIDNNSAHPTINDELPNRIASGTVRVKLQIKFFTENGLTFVDGTSIEGVDTVSIQVFQNIKGDIICLSR